MKGTGMQTAPKHKVAKEPKTREAVELAKHEQMIRREPNHNVHVITHHGKVQVGRKGRTT